VRSGSRPQAATQDRQTAGAQNRKRVAFWAAEAGLAEARNDMRNGGTPALPSSTSVGDSSLYPYGTPRYVPEEITDLGSAPIPGFQLRRSGNGPTYQLHFFRVRVRGEDPNGSQARVEMVANAIDTSS
jgi:Tfp pilus assembly protein PilX